MNNKQQLDGNNAPVKEGEMYTGNIESVGGKGDGILRIKGFVVFVSGVQKGDYVKVKVTKVLPKVSFGELVEKVEPPKSPRERQIEQEDDELSELLTTDGDSEEFGNSDDEDEEF